MCVYNLAEVYIPLTPNNLSKRGQRPTAAVFQQIWKKRNNLKGRFKDAGTTHGRRKEGANDTTEYICTYSSRRQNKEARWKLTLRSALTANEENKPYLINITYYYFIHFYSLTRSFRTSINSHFSTWIPPELFVILNKFLKYFKWPEVEKIRLEKFPVRNKCFIYNQISHSKLKKVRPNMEFKISLPNNKSSALPLYKLCVFFPDVQAFFLDMRALNCFSKSNNTYTHMYSPQLINSRHLWTGWEWVCNLYSSQPEWG